MKRRAVVWIAAAALAPGGLCAGGQTAAQGAAEALNETGAITVGGRLTSYLIRRLPVNSFPQLPAPVANLLVERGCLIPQTYEAHQPENVIEGSLERRGSKDWAVLCSEKGTVSLLVFFADSATGPRVLATAPETERLKAHGETGVLGFDWAIDTATPEQVHEAQAGMQHPPPRLDHDALAETVIDETTVYHYYEGNAWVMVPTGD
jgi:hypothetical protein